MRMREFGIAEEIEFFENVELLIQFKFEEMPEFQERMIKLVKRVL